MATLTIPDLDDAVHARLRARAEEHGRSAEEEARDILEDAVDQADDATGGPGSGAALFARLRAIFADVGGVDLPAFPDAVYEPPPFFGEDEEDANEA